jgi:hypothetical protein
MGERMKQRRPRTFTIMHLMLLVLGFSILGATCHHLFRPYKEVARLTSADDRLIFLVERDGYSIEPYSQYYCTILSGDEATVLLSRQCIGIVHPPDRERHFWLIQSGDSAVVGLLEGEHPTQIIALVDSDEGVVWAHKRFSANDQRYQRSIQVLREGHGIAFELGEFNPM